MQAYSQPAVAQRTVGGDFPALATATAAGDPLATWLASLTDPGKARYHDLSDRRGRAAAPDRRYHHRRLVGEGGLGRLLAVGPQGNGRALLLDDLRALHAPAHAQQLARPALRLGVGVRLHLDHVLLPRRQHLDLAGCTATRCSERGCCRPAAAWWGHSPLPKYQTMAERRLRATLNFRTSSRANARHAA